MRRVGMIAAIGRSGQLGLNGELPWGDQFPEDRKRFREVTRGALVIVGHRTFSTICHLEGTAGRHFIRDVSAPVDQFLAEVERNAPGKPIWIAGGAKTYRRWYPVCTHVDLTILDYDGPADVWLPPLFTKAPQ